MTGMAELSPTSGMLYDRTVPVSCHELLAVYRRRPGPQTSGRVRFGGVDGRDVYNIAAPFMLDGRQIIAGRVESRSTELSDVVFFRQTSDGVWVPLDGTPILHGLQDPTITYIRGRIVVGGVRFPIELPGGERIWRMEFYCGESLRSLRLVFTGPDKMKDIRLSALPDGQVGIMTRPQGARGGRGTIGWTTVKSLDDVTAALIDEAPLLEGQFTPEEWGGCNELHVLKNGLLGVLGHIACFDDLGHRHYYPMAFVFDPVTARRSPVWIIAQRSDFPDGPAKRPDLVDVVFSGGLIRHGNGYATLYAGLSDAEAAWLRLPDPFAGYE